MKKQLLYCLVLISALVSLTAFAQSDITNRGRDFRFAFLPNYHNTGIETNRDTLYVFVSALTPANVLIEWTERDGDKVSAQYQITNDRPAIVHGIEQSSLELRGYNLSGNIVSDRTALEFRTDLNRPVGNSLRVTADADVVVYILNSAQTTADATLVLPTKVLGTDHMVMSYPSDGLNDFGFVDNSSTPSQFCIVATEDNTTVSIESACDLWLADRNQTVTLNAGQVYLVQASVRDDARADVSGSMVRSDKKIAVFAGHQRARVPSDDAMWGNPSRDYLLSQIPPISSLSNNAFVPLPPPVVINGIPRVSFNDEVRILAVEDGTISINGAPTLLARGTILRQTLLEPLNIQSTGKIAVSVFKQTSSVFGQGSQSDPFFLLMPPVEQYDTAFVVYAHGLDNSDRYEAYISVLIRTTEIPFLEITPRPVRIIETRAIPGSEYSYVTYRSDFRTYRIRSEDPVLPIVYGYANAFSYAYLGGIGPQIVRSEQARPIVAQAEPQCLSWSGVVRDTGTTATGVASIRIKDGTSRNVVCEVDSTEIPAGATVTARLATPYEDGYFEFFSQDVAGNYGISRVDIGGHTVAVDVADRAGIPVLDSMQYKQNATMCRTVTIRNYGVLPKTGLVRLAGPGSLANGASLPLSFSLQPGQQQQLEVCWQAGALDFNDTVLVELSGDCLSRAVYAVSVDVIPDTVRPAVTVVESDTCDAFYSTIVADAGEFDTGIASADVISSQNCTVEIFTLSDGSVRITATAQDKSADASFAVEVVDIAGNRSVITRSIPIPTLSVGAPRPAVLTVSVQGDDGFACDTVMINNSGNAARTIQAPSFVGVSRFSIPPSQFPLTVPANSSVPLVVCYDAGQGIFAETDEMIIDFECGSESVLLEAQKSPVSIAGTSICEVPVLITQPGPSALASVAVRPSPASDYATVLVPSALGSSVEWSVVDLRGIAVAAGSLRGLNYPAEMELNTSSLAAGSYVLVLRGSHRAERLSLVIAR